MNPNINGVILWIMGATGVLFLYSAFTGYTASSIIQSYAVPGTQKVLIGGGTKTAKSSSDAGTTGAPTVAPVSYASVINADGSGAAGTINSPAAGVLNV